MVRVLCLILILILMLILILLVMRLGWTEPEEAANFLLYRMDIIG